MNQVADPSRVVSLSLVVLAAVAVAVALAYTRALMVPFVLAIFITYLVTPLVEFLRRRLRLPRVLSVLIALAATVGLLILLGALISSSAGRLGESAEIYEREFAAMVTWAVSALGRFGFDLGQEPLVDAVRQLPILSMVRSTLGTIVDLAATLVLVVVFVMYLLLSRRPPELKQGVYAEINARIRKYLAVKFVISAATGAIVGSILALFGLDLALVFGVMAFLLNFIPSIGSVVATLLPIPIAILQFDNPWTIAAVVLIPGVVQLVIGNGVEPVVMGEGLDLHPIAILLALILWGLLWGPVGMLLAAPMTAILRIILERGEATRPIAGLLAGRIPPSR